MKRLIFALAFLLLFSTGFSAVKYWSSTSATGWDLASNASAWSGGTLPANNDAIIFNSTSVVGCAWDIVNFNATLFEVNTSYTGTINITSNLINFGMLDFISTGGNLNISKDTIGSSVDSHYHAGTVNLFGNLTLAWLQEVGSTFNANGNINITSGFIQSGGTFNGNISVFMTVAGNIQKTSGTFTSYMVNLIDIGNSTFSSDSNMYFSNITITTGNSLNITPSSSGNLGALRTIYIQSGAYLTIGSGRTYYDYSAYQSGDGTFTNNGLINGSGTINFYFAYLNPTITFGNINSSVTLLNAGMTASRTCTLATNTAIGGDLTVSGSASYSLTLSHGSNYTLTVLGLTTLGANGTMVQGTGAWNFSGGYIQSGVGSTFTQGGNIFVMSNNFTISSGYFTGSASYNLSLYTNLKFNSALFSMTSNTVNLVMETDGNTIGGTSGSAYWVPRTITIKGNTTFSQPFQFYMGGLTVASGKLFNITVAQPVYYQMDANLGLNNLGTITGVAGSTYNFYGGGSVTTFPSNIGIFTIPTVTITIPSWAGANATWTLAGDVNFGGTVYVYSGHATYYMRLVGSNYAFNSSGLFRLGANAVITQGTGKWNFSGGYVQNGNGSLFTQGGNVTTPTFDISNGTFTGDGVNWLAITTFFNKTGGTVTDSLTNLKINGSSTTLNANGAYIAVKKFWLASGTATLSATTANWAVYGSSGLLYQQDAGTVLSIPSGKIVYPYCIATFIFNGEITGAGYFRFAHSSSLPSWNMPDMTNATWNVANVQINVDAGPVNVSKTINMSSDWTINGNLTVAGNGYVIMNLSHGSNYALTVGGLTTLSTNASMASGTGTWNFSGGYLQNGTGSNFFQGGLIYVKNMTVSAGLFWGNAKDIYVFGNITGGVNTFVSYASRIIMDASGDGNATINFNYGTLWHSIAFNRNTTIRGTGSGAVTVGHYTSPAYNITTAPGVIVNASVGIGCYGACAVGWVNNGSWIGSGTLDFSLRQTNISVPIGNISCPFEIELRIDSNGNKNFTFTQNEVFGSNFTVDSKHGLYNLTIEGSGYNLTIGGDLRLGKNTTIKQGGGIWSFSNANVSGNGLYLAGNISMSGKIDVEWGAIKNATLNETNFDIGGVNTRINLLQSFPPNATNITTIGKYLNITNTSSAISYNLNISYDDNPSAESKIAMRSYAGSWAYMGSTTDIVNNIVSVLGANSVGVIGPVIDLNVWPQTVNSYWGCKKYSRYEICFYSSDIYIKYNNVLMKVN